MNATLVSTFVSCSSGSCAQVGTGWKQQVCTACLNNSYISTNNDNDLPPSQPLRSAPPPPPHRCHMHWRQTPACGPVWMSSTLPWPTHTVGTSLSGSACQRTCAQQQPTAPSAPRGPCPQSGLGADDTLSDLYVQALMRAGFMVVSSHTTVSARQEDRAVLDQWSEVSLKK